MPLKIAEKHKSEVASERALGVLWQKAHVIPEGLSTEDGRRFRVIYPGRANSRAGPDFHDAIIITENGDQITGDVELHLNAPDWHSHHHDTDPNYNGVILHVVLKPKHSTTSRQQTGINVPVASLASHVPHLERLEITPGYSLPHLQALDEHSLWHLLDRAGEKRFLAKSRGFALELANGYPDQVLYRSIMEALGYASNRKPFVELAERMPISSLMRLRREPDSTRLLALKAALISASGLLSFVQPAEEARELRRLRKRLPRIKGMSAKHWNMFRVRPANHPIARLIGAAHLIERVIQAGLVRSLARDIRQGNSTTLTKKLTVLPFIGQSRARDISVNVVLPFMHAHGGIGRSPGLSKRCLEIYDAFPKLNDNEITREMARLLSSEATPISVTGARRQQGLIHLYKSLAT